LTLWSLFHRQCFSPAEVELQKSSGPEILKDTSNDRPEVTRDNKTTERPSRYVAYIRTLSVTSA
jgi:hypothetical protein